MQDNKPDESPLNGALTRRDFLKGAALAGACVLSSAAGIGSLPVPAQAGTNAGVHEARYWEALDGGRVRCNLCPWKCVTSNGQRGVCRVRENRGGKYYTLVYGEAAAMHVDPIEKKPLYHFKPGQRALSVGTAGCNLRCRDCQNWEISQRTPEELRSEGLLTSASPQALVSKARANNIPVIAYTYNEPIVFYEYMYDTAALARQSGIQSVMISSGGINREPMLALAPYLDAVKIDLKGFSEDFYREYTSGRLAPIKETIKRVIALGKWLEIVYLVVPTVNDADDTIRAMSDWLVKVGGPDLPLHFSRFFPAYRLKNLPATPVETLRRCRDIARAAGLRHVYVGNIRSVSLSSTYCPNCGNIVVKRDGYRVLSYDLKPNGACRFCGTKIAGIW
jgi:pyruvate formate lyase activating enzyme